MKLRNSYKKNLRFCQNLNFKYKVCTHKKLSLCISSIFELLLNQLKRNLILNVQAF